ncbi:MAG TPA: hypothetical protein PLJ20_00290, partial [Candidatus Contendobacter sp.]|nr:hypothetical protein [Candidatus Contendobacter sp.]
MIDVKNFPFLGLIMESLGEKQAKRCLTEFSGVSGKEATLPSPPPLRTERDSFPSLGSSLS